MTTLIDTLPTRRLALADASDRRFARAEAALDEFEAAVRMLPKLEDDTGRGLLKQLMQVFVQERRRAFFETGTLTRRLNRSVTIEQPAREEGRKISAACDSLHEITSGLTLELADLRKAADSLGYVIVSTRLFDPADYPDEQVRQQASAFIDATEKRGMLTYIFGPPEVYSPLAQYLTLSDKGLPRVGAWELRSYAGRSIGSSLRTLINYTTLLYGEFRIDSVSRWDVHLYHGWMSELEEYLRRSGASSAVAKERVEMVFKLIKDRAKQDAERERASFDPIMFALPEEAVMTDNRLAFVGPCWGPSLGKEILALIRPLFAMAQQALKG